ncbi:MAG TPA: hypothetical protein VJN92_04385 [Candidatus Acidoferrum sp.]|nr:hypothetical protein [Candidatus Acidoferrum sp.]
MDHEAMPSSFGGIDGKRILSARDRATYLLGDAYLETATQVVFRAAASVPGTTKSREANIKKALDYDGEHRACNRAYLDICQTFDYRVMTELSDAEREQESNGYRLSEADFIKRFVKHLILLSLSRNSFWAAVAVFQVLCNYPTSALDLVYPFVAPNRSIDKDKWQCSRNRGKLLKFIGERFGVCPENLFIEDGPQVYSPLDWQVRTIKECLAVFRPLGRVTVPERYRGSLLLPYDENDHRGDERIEVDRMAILFSPTDLNRILAWTGTRSFEESTRRLNFAAVPKKPAVRKYYA